MERKAIKVEIEHKGVDDIRINITATEGKPTGVDFINAAYELLSIVGKKDIEKINGILDIMKTFTPSDAGIPSNEKLKDIK